METNIYSVGLLSFGRPTFAFAAKWLPSGALPYVFFFNVISGIAVGVVVVNVAFY